MRLDVSASRARAGISRRAKGKAHLQLAVVLPLGRAFLGRGRVPVGHTIEQAPTAGPARRPAAAAAVAVAVRVPTPLRHAGTLTAARRQRGRRRVRTQLVGIFPLLLQFLGPGVVFVGVGDGPRRMAGIRRRRADLQAGPEPFPRLRRRPTAATTTSRGHGHLQGTAVAQREAVAMDGRGRRRRRNLVVVFLLLLTFQLLGAQVAVRTGWGLRPPAAAVGRRGVGLGIVLAPGPAVRVPRRVVVIAPGGRGRGRGGGAGAPRLLVAVPRTLLLEKKVVQTRSTNH